MNHRIAENETQAHDLISRMQAAGIDAEVVGRGVQWRVDVAPVGTRSLCVHCFWYERAVSGLMLGMNPSNARSRLSARRAPREGPEYYTILMDGEARIADGRARDADEVVACTRAWLAGATLEEVVQAAPFVDRRGRASRAMADRLDPSLRSEVGQDPSYELWVYGDGRSCKLIAGEADDFSCRFFVGQAEVAYAPALCDVPATVALWLLSRCPLAELPQRVTEVELERHAEILVRDPARWHWLHLADRIADPNDVLAPLASLIRALAENPIVTRFYSYSSLNRLCFSASSHYPWVDRGLPVVMPGAEGVHWVDDERCDFSSALARIEASLAASPVTPFFGSAPHHELPNVRRSLERRGSALRAELVQHDAWYWLEVAAGSRKCRVSGLEVTFFDADQREQRAFGDLEESVRAVCRYLEDGAAVDELGGSS